MSSATDARAVAFAALHERVADAVRRVAATDPSPADPFRGLYVSDDLACALAGGAAPDDADDRFAAAAAALGLDALDAAVLGVCALPEIDARHGRLVAYLHDDVTQRLASPRLVARLLSGAGVRSADVLRCFAADGALRRSGALALLDGDGSVPVADRPVKVHDRVAAFLLGARLDAGGGRGLREVAVPGLDIGRPEVVARLRGVLARARPGLPVLVAGADAPAVVARAAGRPLLVADAGALDAPGTAAEIALAAALDGRLPCVEGVDDAEPGRWEAAIRALEERGHPAVVLASEPGAALALGDRTVTVVEVRLPAFAERERAWSDLAPGAPVREAAAKFRLSIAQVQDAAEAAALTAHVHGRAVPAAEDLDHGARQASSMRLTALAARLEPVFGWDDLVLPDRTRELLRGIFAYLRHRDRVLQDWGYERAVARRQGIKALFCGESGTGKTMAAQVLAHELGLELYRVDLATVVSKYIGETEKNLDRVFTAAEGSNAILFFDEADALFGKRSEVSDAHDRYANIEVAFLLQKMEGYPGAVVLATNLRNNVDEAFLRRLDFVIDFPFPEADDRRRIWERMLPAPAPVGPDVDLDFLASRFRLSGGAIRNCSLAAAFSAADDGQVINMPHLVRAVATEYAKLGRLTLEADFERFHGLLQADG